MYNMKKSLLCLLLAAMVLATSILPALAEDIPYDTYNYDYWGNIVRTPAAYDANGKVLGTDLEWQGKPLGAFAAPEDMVVAPDGSIYVADTNNHRIVVLSSDLKTVLNVITSFDNRGKQDAFNKPTGVAVTEREVQLEDETWEKKTFIHIADSLNHRVVVLDDAGVLQQIIEMPAQAETQSSGATYEVGTYVEGMDQNSGVIYRTDSDVYAAVNLPAGSAGEVTDAEGRTYTVIAVSDALEPFDNELLVDASVSGEVVENGEKADLITLAVKNGKDIQHYTGTALTVQSANGKVAAAEIAQLTDAQGALMGYLLHNEDGVLYMDADGAPLAFIGQDGSVTLSDEDGDKVNGLKWADGQAVFTQDSGEAIATAGKNGEVIIHDAKGNTLAVLDKTGVLKDAEGDEIAQLNADGTTTLRGKDGKALCLLTKDGTDVTLHDAAGSAYAVIDKNGNVTLLDAAGAQKAGFAFDGKGVEYALPSGDTAAVIRNDEGIKNKETIAAVNAKGDILASLKKEGEVTLLLGASDKELAALRPDGSIHLRDKDGADIAVITLGENGLVVKNPDGTDYANVVADENGTVVNNEKNKEIVAFNADNALLIRDSKKKDAALLAVTEEGFAITVLESGNTMTLAADGRISYMDAQGAEYACVDSAARIVNARGKTLAALKQEGEITLVLDADAKELAALHQDGTIHVRGKKDADEVVEELIIRDAKKSEVAKLTRTEEGFAITALQTGEAMLLAADGSVSYRNAEGGAMYAFVGGDELTVLDAQGAVIATGDIAGTLAFTTASGDAMTIVNDAKAGKTVLDAAGKQIAFLQKNGSVTIATTEKDGTQTKVGAVTMEGGNFNIENDKAKDLAVVNAADLTVSCVDSKGKEIAFVAADGSITMRQGGKDMMNIAEGVIAMGEILSHNHKTGASFIGPDGQVYATLSFNKNTAQVKNGAMDFALLKQTNGTVRLEDAMGYAAKDTKLLLTQEDGSILTITLKSGTTAYTAAADGKGYIRIPTGGKATGFSKYDPVPKKDVFMLIGRLVTGAKTTGMTNTRNLWVDGEGNVYAVSDKNATKLDSKGKLHRVFASYKDDKGEQITFSNITEFAVVGDNLYLRDGANKIVVLNQEGDLVKVIASNAVQVKDADGNVIATYTGAATDEGEETFSGITGLMIVDDMLLAGQSNGQVLAMDKQGAYIDTLENETVMHLNAEGEIVEKLTETVVGKKTERFSGLSGVSMADGKLCVIYGDKRIAVLGEEKAELVRQRNAVIVRNGDAVSYITGYEGEDGFVTFSNEYGVEGVALNYTSDPTAPAAQRVKRQLCVADNEDHLIVYRAEEQENEGQKETVYKTMSVVKDPDSEVLEEGYVFTPKKVAVDYAGRVYCIAEHMFEGIMVFETNGDFTGFFGTIEVTISAWDKFWRKLATKEERSKQQLFIPTEFTGIDIDEEGFVYASNVDNAGLQAVRRLNPKGEDVIRMGLNANLGGDIEINGTSDYAGASMIRDVVYRGKGVYSLLDTKRGRIFTYDHEGNLLYIFGGLGTTAGTFTQPVAIEFVNSSLIVLDSSQNSILLFNETDYGRLINEAVGLRFDGDETKAIAKWEKVLEYDENNELANTGIGKAYLSAGENRKAMTYLKRGMNKEYYSVAFKRYRNELLEKNIPYVLTGVVVLAVALTIYLKAIKPKLKAKRGNKKDEYGATFAKTKLGHLFYTVGHPGDGYYWIRHREMGSVWIALALVLLFGLAFSLNRLFASFVVSDVNVRTVNLLPELAGVVLMYILLCVGNWSITCLMDGEGRFKDICIAIGYALLPMIATYVLATIVSQFLADGEQAFYGIIMGIGIAYTLIMALTGIMQVHNYTLGKTLLTLFLTIVAMLIVIFLVLLVTSFIGQVITFFKSIYTELIFRV